ncbi:ORFL282W, partial [Human betaherpesvirus 5]
GGHTANNIYAVKDRCRTDKSFICEFEIG